MFVPRHQFAISLVTILLALVGIVGFIIYPEFQDIIGINNIIAQEKSTLEKKLALGLNIKTTEETLANIEQSQPILDSIFIHQGKELEFITEIEQVAAQHNVQLELKPDFTGKPLTPNISTVTIEMSVAGNYPNTQDFLRSLEQLPYYYVTDALIMSRPESTTTTTMQLLGRAYLLK